MCHEWYVDGLAVHPEHRMATHTDFLLSTRRFVPGVSPQTHSIRPVKSSEEFRDQWGEEDSWSDATVGLRTAPEKKLRKVREDVQAKAGAWIEGKKKANE